MSDKYLSVYKASAGSGKTYSLVYRYVLLLFGAEGGETVLGRVLAVTFTNKSTAEMKERVVRALYEMAEGRHEAYISDIMRDLPGRYKSAEAVTRRARRLLMQVLFNYSVFNIKTIDAFFQQVIRVFAREMNMYGSFKVELDTEAVLEAAVDDILVNLKAPSKMLDWLTEFAEARVDDGYSYKIKDVIAELAAQIFSDEYIKNAARLNAALSAEDAMPEYRRSLAAVVSGYEAEVKRLCDRIKGVMGELSLSPEEFKGGARSFASYFTYINLKNKDFSPPDTFMKAIGDGRQPEMYCTKSSDRREDIEAFYRRTGDEMDKLAAALSAEGQRDYRTARALEKNLYVVGILNDIQNRILERSKETNAFLLTSTSDFIRQIIEGSDTPFIYEKMGVSLDHYMIDEFQDTSKLQWSNFLPLLHDSVDSGKWNMVVGDIKQSIYRWRDGDWSILQSDVRREFGECVEEVVLDTNFRSSRSVVKGNNSLFPQLAEMALGDIEAVSYENLDTDQGERRKGRFRSIYADVRQKNRLDREGYVEMGFIGGDEQKEDAMERMYGVICDLTERCGYGYRDITILVRKNSEAMEIAEYLQERGVAVMSNEAQLVCNASTVRFIVALMRYMYKPAESLFRAELAVTYCRLRGEDERMHEVMTGSELTGAEWERRLFGEEGAEKLSRVKNLTLYRLAESAVSIFDLYSAADGEAHYLQAFMDDVYDFAAEESADLYTYLEHYDKRAGKFFVPSAGGGDAVSIYTIFKSKGLQFKVVIIPFCNWGLEPDKHHVTYRWVETTRPPFDRLPIVPVDMGRGGGKLYSTWFADDMRDEYENCFIDTLNVTYVAFTRAIERMYVFPLLREKDGVAVKECSVPYYLYNAVNADNSSFTAKDDERTLYIGDSGEVKAEERTAPPKAYDFGEQEAGGERDVESRLKFRADKEVLWSMNGEGYSYVDYGNVMHHILEKVTVAGELGTAIESVRNEGVFSSEEEAGEIRAKLERFIADDMVRDWFSGKYRVMKEAEIITEDGDVYRPDRVMTDDEDGSAVVIDYKFGEEISQRYERQVKRYMKLIGKMGYAPVRGYICYVERGENVEVQ